MSDPVRSKHTTPPTTVKTQAIQTSKIQPGLQNESTQLPDGVQAENLINLPDQPSTLEVRRAAVQRMQQTSGNLAVQRILEDEEKDKLNAASSSIARQLESRRGQGSPIAPEVQSQLEDHLKTDLSAVRVHTDSTAHRLARQLQAKAFTTGQDIYFRSGTYAPESPKGHAC